MRSQLGPVGTVLSVAFALFIITVLFLIKLWYLRRSRWAPALKKQAPLGRTGALKARSVWHFSGNVEGKALESWGKTLAMWCRGPPFFQVQEDGGDKQKEQRIEDGGDAEEAGKEQEEEEEEDVLSLGGLLGAARLLFTIREETMEEMQVEEARCSNFEDAHGKKKAGNGNTSSGSASPFVTPPSSPPFATPFGSPALKIPDPSEHRPPLPLRAADSADVPESVSASASSSSSSSSPVLLGGRPPSLLFFDDSTDTCTASSSPSLATPTALSPTSPPACSSDDNRRIFLQDPPHSPSSLLSYNCHTNRVYPLDNKHLHGSCILENKLQPLSPLSVEKLDEPSRSFHLPPLSQPSTPSPFRSSLFAKARTQGAASSPALLLHPRFFPIR